MAGDVVALSSSSSGTALFRPGGAPLAVPSAGGHQGLMDPVSYWGVTLAHIEAQKRKEGGGGGAEERQQRYAALVA